MRIRVFPHIDKLPCVNTHIRIYGYAFFIRVCVNTDFRLKRLYGKACNEFAGPISASLRPGNTAPFEEKQQRWRAVGNTVPNLTGPRFEPQTYRT